MRRPNVLLVCCDMIAAKHFGCYGDPAEVTPNVDALAERGVRFDEAHCNCPPCIPARVSMMCGQYAHTHGKTAHILMELQPRPALIPEILSSQGYRTGLVGKTHWWPPTDTLGCDIAHITIDNHRAAYELGDNDAYFQFLRDRGLFDYNESTWEQDKHLLDADNLPFDCLKVNWTGDTTCSLLDTLSGGKVPFFLYCSFVEPHWSGPHGAGSVQTDYLEKFRDIPLRPIISRDGEHDNKPDVQKNTVARLKTIFADRDLDRERRSVYASLSLVDQNIGKIVNKLDQLGVKDNTVVIFLSDHGDLMFDHGCIEKTFLYDSAVRIPLIMAGPGIPQGEERRHLVGQIDLLPTILDLCGIKEDGLLIDGQSMLPILAAPASEWRKTLFSETEQSVHVLGPPGLEECVPLVNPVSSSIAKMLRTGSWKYIYTLVDGHVVAEELYNLDDDPDELYNVAYDSVQTERIIEFRSEMLRWLIATEVNRLHPVPENKYPVPRVDKRYL